MTLKPPLEYQKGSFSKFVKCKLSNGFPNNHESWELLQPYPCDIEIFELRLPHGRNCSRVWIDRYVKDVNEKLNKIDHDCKVISKNADDKQGYHSHTVTIPRVTEVMISPPVHVIHWEFSE